MCGIAGVLYFDQREPDMGILENMAGTMTHRGPDDAGFLIDRGLGLAFRRLSIIDLQGGHQPIPNEDETVWIVLNGEIYNYRELAASLTALGHTLKTRTDTETIVHLYEEYGRECVKHLRGMFSFVIWDKPRRELFAARDFFGIKPFYYYRDGEKFAFASEIKSLLALDGTHREVAPESLLNFLTFQYIPDPSTLLQGVYKLPPGHRLCVSGGRMHVEQYWDPGFEPTERPFNDYVEELREAVRDSVKHHMLSDVRRGCFLSSGVDSSSIAALMRREEPIKTFTVGFDGPNNECPIARETAASLGTEHYEKIISPEEYFEAVPAAVWHQDEPVADPAAIALYFVAGLAREHVTVVLSGEGADELFGGYAIYREPLSLRGFDFLPPRVKAAAHRMLAAAPEFRGRNFLLRGTTPLELRFIGNAKLFTEERKAAVTTFAPDLLGSYRNPFEIAGDFYDRSTGLDSITRMQYIDIKLWLPGDILMKADKMTMAHSLELRVPFLDTRVFEVARRIPARFRVCSGTTKYALRQAMKGIVPDAIVGRPKLGFPVPLRDWMRQGWAPHVLETIRAGGIEGFIRMDAVEKMVQQHLDGRRDLAREIWTLFIFAKWHDLYIQSAGAWPLVAASSVNRREATVRWLA